MTFPTLAAARADVLARLADPRTLAARLGLLSPRPWRPQAGGGVSVQCVAPSHADGTPSLSLTVGTGGTLRAVCHGCGFRGSVLDVLAAYFGLDVKRDFGEVMRHARDLAGTDAPPRPWTPPPPREPPPIEEVRAVLQQGLAPADSPAAGWLRARGLDPAACTPLARVIRSTWPAWARAGDPPRPWAAGPYRLLLPVYDAAGALRSVRVRRIRGSSGPKEIAPLGCAATGFVFANRAAVEVLRGAAGPVLVVEGAPDYLTWATVAPRRAVIGLPGSGAITPGLLAALAPHEVELRLHEDDAGERYARMLLAGCPRATRGRGGDQNDLLRVGALRAS